MGSLPTLILLLIYRYSSRNQATIMKTLLIFLFAFMVLDVECLSSSTRTQIENQHNQERQRGARQFGGTTKRVRYSRNLESLAQNHANKCTQSHSRSASSSGNGENLWWGWGSCSGENCSGNCPNRDGGQNCGHWTQIIWQDTKQVGCGVAQCGQNTEVHCFYSPAGNMYFNGSPEKAVKF